MSRPDIKPLTHPELSWEPREREQSLLTVFAYGENHARQVINWYLAARRGKKFCAQTLRLGAIVLTAIGGLFPIYAGLNPVVVEPAWASVSIGIAALFLGIDRFFGCSAAWMRFIATEHKVRQLFHGFQIDCESDRAGWGGHPPAMDQVQTGLARTRAFLIEVDELVRQETDTWLTEFQNAIREIDKSAQVGVKIAETGDINVTVTNGDQMPGGWGLKIGEGVLTNHTGRMTAVTHVSPATYRIHVEATVDGARREAAQAIQVVAGQISHVELTL